MSDEKNITLLGDLSGAAKVLVEKVSDAVGGVFKPYQIVRVAKAEAEATEIQARSEIKITDLQRRAMRRFLEEEAKRQTNIEAITEKALPLLEDKSVPQNMSDDWITNFFDKSRIISDTDMQVLWSRILAGEANTTGTFSKKTVNLLADMDKSDAELFTNFCGFCWVFNDNVPLIFDTREKIYQQEGITFDSIIHLESLGIIQTMPDGYGLTDLPKRKEVAYFGRPVCLTFMQDRDNDLESGTAVFTRAGQQLSRVSGSKPVAGFFEFVYDRWASESLVPMRDTESMPSKMDSSG